ncbi:unnamed protein product [Onchocerca flexuosa]|uniref:Uncharacterized protein n=1 Tax=Onchocerca flexuosa TaxID=387005 RepID=A0A183I191_9BILA|nr:unnamed protein product [Onchocerca flexuosa]
MEERLSPNYSAHRATHHLHNDTTAITLIILAISAPLSVCSKFRLEGVVSCCLSHYCMSNGVLKHANFVRRQLHNSVEIAREVHEVLVLCEKADQLINEDDSQILIHPEMHSLRSRIIKLCKTILIDAEWGRRILDRVWKSCYYSVICRIRKTVLRVEQKNWTEKLISTFVKELCVFANDFAYLRAVICLYIGDLRRYAWLIYGVEKYRNLSLLCYR